VVCPSGCFIARRCLICERLRFSLLVSQSLNLPIVVAYLEVHAGLMSPQVGAALVGGILLSVLLVPSLAMAVRRWTCLTQMSVC